MIPILYESNETAFASNGLGRLRDCITCTVTEERNGIYECDFEYPIDGANYDKIQPGRIIAVRHDDSNDVQPFDIVSYSKPIDGVVTFHAVHISYRLRGYVVYGTNINTLADAFTYIKANATPSNPFTYEADFTSTAYMGAMDGTPRSVRSMLGGVQGSILDSYGGEFEFDRFRVILHRNRGTLRDFSIRYGVNLLDYQEDTDYSETFNAAVPYWVGSDGVKDILVVGTKAIGSSATYTGRQICAALDLSDKFESKPTKTQLKNAALNYITNNQTVVPQQTISVDFVRLQDLGEYENLKALLECNLCDSINVIFPKYNMQGRYKIVKTVFDVIRGKYEKLELGALSTTLADALGISDSTTPRAEVDYIYLNDDDKVEVNADMIVNGDLYVKGHSSPVGALVTASLSANKNIANQTVTELFSFDLAPGAWIVQCSVRYPSNATGRRYANLSTVSAENVADITNNAVNGGVTQLTFVKIVYPSKTTTYYVNAYQNSGGALTMPSGTNNGIRAIRIR